MSASIMESLADFHNTHRNHLPRNLPLKQFLYTFSTSANEWQILTSPSPPLYTSSVTIITWNIDALAPFAFQRMTAALSYLELLTSSLPESSPAIIFLQEMLCPDLDLIQAAPWIRSRYAISDIRNIHWGSKWYGTTVLVDRQLNVAQVFRVHYDNSIMDRDGLFVDLFVGRGTQPKGHQSEHRTVVRFCNTHLESLVADPPLRPAQLALAANFLSEPNVFGGILAGDLNAIQAFDRTLHLDTELTDTYLACGGVEDSDDGFTWGQQAPAAERDRFGCSRMDKILYCGGVKVEELERIGEGVKVTEKDGEGEWASDHLGLMGRVKFIDSGRFYV